MTSYGYQRTSTDAQLGSGQHHVLIAAGIPAERIYVDTGVSGMKASRPEFDRLLATVKSGDVIVTPELSRLGRSVKNLLALVEDLDARGVGIRILNLGGQVVDTATPSGKFFLTVLMALSELERNIIASRTREALAALKADGVVLGGSKRKISDATLASARRLQAKGMTPASIADVLQIPRSSAYRYLSQTA